MWSAHLLLILNVGSNNSRSQRVDHTSTGQDCETDVLKGVLKGVIQDHTGSYRPIQGSRSLAGRGRPIECCSRLLERRSDTWWFNDACALGLHRAGRDDPFRCKHGPFSKHFKHIPGAILWHFWDKAYMHTWPPSATLCHFLLKCFVKASRRALVGILLLQRLHSLLSLTEALAVSPFPLWLSPSLQVIF
jgi:hypothetical protein